MISRLAIVSLAFASLGGGAVAGAALFTPVVSGAQTETLTNDSAADEAVTDEQPCRHRHPRRHAALGTAADAIGITADELRAALEAGQTIADVAEANDVEVEAVVDALVAAAEEKLAQAVEDGRIDEERAAELAEGLEDRITARVNGEGPDRDGLRFHRRRHRGPGSAAAPDDAGEAAETSIELTNV